MSQTARLVFSVIRIYQRKYRIFFIVNSGGRSAGESHLAETNAIYMRDQRGDLVVRGWESCNLQAVMSALLDNETVQHKLC